MPTVGQDNLAKLVGTTHSRINHFVNRFRNPGFTNYGDNDRLMIHSDLLSVVLYD